jgi:hypothetical protein
MNAETGHQVEIGTRREGVVPFSGLYPLSRQRGLGVVRAEGKMLHLLERVDVR